MKFTWDISPIILELGETLQLRYYGLIFSCVFIGGFLLFRWQVRRAGGSEDDAYAIVLPGALGTVIGARLGHCLFYQPERLISDPLWVFKIWQGGLASHGALLGLLIAIFYYARKNRQSYLECLDRFSFSAALGATLVRIGNFFNSEIVGRLTDGSWGVRFPLYDRLPPEAAPLRHPSQLYEATMGLVIMGVLLIVDRAWGREKRPRGLLAGAFLTVYFLGRFLVEFFKEYQTLPSTSALTMGQVLSIPAFLVGVILLRRSLLAGVSASWRVPEPEPAPVKRTGKKKSKKKKRG